MIPRFLSRLNTALAFLTILWIPGIKARRLSDRDLAACFAFFPVVGLILGVLLLTIAASGARRWPPTLVAVWMVILETVLTRGLHMDGLSDCADGIGGAYDPAQRLVIMKDSRVGAFGALAIVSAVLAKVSATSWLISNHQWGSLCLAPVLSRYVMVLVAFKSPYARKDGGLGKAFLENLQLHDLVLATISVLAFSLLLVRFQAWIYLLVPVPMAFTVRRCAGKALGGVTGDVLGATNEMTEMIVWSLAAALC